MKLVAILKDSWVQTLDCKSLYVMLIVCAVFIALCASVSYAPMDEHDAVKDLVQLFRAVHWSKGMDVRGVTYNVALEVGELRKQDGWYEFQLTVKGRDEWRKLVRHWDAIGQKCDFNVVPDKEIDPPLQLEQAFLRSRFREQMIPKVEVTSVSEEREPRVFDVRIRPHSEQTFAGAHQVRILFGAYGFRLPPPLNVAVFVFLMEGFLSEWCAGLAGVALALLFTGGFIPAMLQKGSLDVLLARPVSRVNLLLLKYVGGLLYATVTSVVFIGGSWVALSARSGIWNWGFLATGGTLIFFFGVLYSVGVLFAVMTRSTIAATIMPFVVWLLAWGFDLARKVLFRSELIAKLPSAVNSVMDGVWYVLPKPSSLNDVNTFMMAKGSFGAVMEGADIPIPEIAWAKVILSQVAFAVVILAFASWRFARKDY